jgi:hypothetical protein
MKITTLIYLPSVQLIVDEQGRLLSHSIDWSSSYDSAYDDDGNEINDVDEETFDKLIAIGDQHLDDLVLKINKPTKEKN